MVAEVCWNVTALTRHLFTVPITGQSDRASHCGGSRIQCWFFQEKLQDSHVHYLTSSQIAPLGPTGFMARRPCFRDKPTDRKSDSRSTYLGRATRIHQSVRLLWTAPCGSSYAMATPRRVLLKDSWQKGKRAVRPTPPSLLSSNISFHPSLLHDLSLT